MLNIKKILFLFSILTLQETQATTQEDSVFCQLTCWQYCSFYCLSSPQKYFNHLRNYIEEDFYDDEISPKLDEKSQSCHSSPSKISNRLSNQKVKELVTMVKKNPKIASVIKKISFSKKDLNPSLTGTKKGNSLGLSTLNSDVSHYDDPNFIILPTYNPLKVPPLQSSCIIHSKVENPPNGIMLELSIAQELTEMPSNKKINKETLSPFFGWDSENYSISNAKNSIDRLVNEVYEEEQRLRQEEGESSSDSQEESISLSVQSSDLSMMTVGSN